MKDNLKAWLMITSATKDEAKALQAFLNSTFCFFFFFFPVPKSRTSLKQIFKTRYHSSTLGFCFYIWFSIADHNGEAEFYIFIQSFKMFQLFHLGYFS